MAVPAAPVPPALHMTNIQYFWSHVMNITHVSSHMANTATVFTLYLLGRNPVMPTLPKNFGDSSYLLIVN